MCGSDVTIQCHFKYAEELERCFSDELKNDVMKKQVFNSFIFSWSNLHWDETREDVNMVMDLLDRWHEEKVSYIFIHLGNEIDDITFCNENIYEETLFESPCYVKRIVTTDLD